MVALPREFTPAMRPQPARAYQPWPLSAAGSCGLAEAGVGQVVCAQRGPAAWHVALEDHLYGREDIAGLRVAIEYR